MFANFHFDQLNRRQNTSRSVLAIVVLLILLSTIILGSCQSQVSRYGIASLSIDSCQEFSLSEDYKIEAISGEAVKINSLKEMIFISIIFWLLFKIIFVRDRKLPTNLKERDRLLRWVWAGPFFYWQDKNYIPSISPMNRA